MDETECIREYYTQEGMTERVVEAFRSVIYDYYARHSRSFPWRETTDPYHIMVSEVMLQQTQTSRAIQKYRLFLNRFPTVHALASASLHDVLEAWQGLGYNRRAKHLQQAASAIIDRFDGTVPFDEGSLLSLPGIGSYTAAAIRAFAFNRPSVVIDTNVRTVFIHFFFTYKKEVDDADIRPLVEATIDRNNPRRWYSALMDYGVMLKQRYENPGRASTSYKRQSQFEGSDRQIRGEIIRLLLQTPGMTRRDIVAAIDTEESRIRAVIDRLCQEDLVTEREKQLFIPQNR